MSDVLSSIGSIQQLASDLSGLGSRLSAAAPSGGFSAVLSQVNAEMNSVADGATPASGSAAVSSPLSTSDKLNSLLTGSTGSSSTGSASASASQVVNDAEQYLGVPYQWGGTNPATGLDCSGLVQRVYKDLGVNLPRTSEEQANVGTPVSSLADAQPGDLVFFAGSDGTTTSPGHVGIYIGDGKMIDAPHTGTDVQIQPVGQPVAIRRILSSPVDLTSSYSSPVARAGGSEVNAGMSALGAPASLQPLFTQAGARYGVDPLLLAAVAKQESGFQPGAQSGAGAQGLMQLMPATAAGLGVSPFDPTQAIDGAAQLLSGYLSKYGGSVPLALAAYNAGPGSVAQYGGVPPYAETRHYVSNITAMLSQAGAASNTVVAQ